MIADLGVDPFQGLIHRLHDDLEAQGGKLSVAHTAAWLGYLAAMRRLGLVAPSQYDRLIAELPRAAGPILRLPSDPPPEGQGTPTETNRDEAIDAALLADVVTDAGIVGDGPVHAWHAYLDGLAGQDGLSWEAYWRLKGLLPAPSEPEAIRAVTLDRLDSDDLEPYIARDIEEHDGLLPDLARIAWKGYLIGLRDQRAITTNGFRHLLAMIGPVALPDPIEVFVPKPGQLPSMPRDEVYARLRQRTRDLVDAFGDRLTDRQVIAWKSYLLALLRGELLDARTYQELAAMLPPYQVPSAVVDNALVRD